MSGGDHASPIIDTLPNLDAGEIDLRRRELHVELARLAERFGELKSHLIQLELQEARFNRELAELALIETRLTTFVAHGGVRHAG